MGKTCNCRPVNEFVQPTFFKKELKFLYKLAIREEASLSIIMVDIDNFKAYNDSFGHQEGDKTLQSVGKILKKTIRETDIAARYGGEEFIILLPGIDKEGSMIACQRLKDAFSSYKWDKRKVTASFGIASIKEKRSEREKAKKLIKKADDALFFSKKNGRNQFTHYDDIKKKK
ncbi:MAG: GGDEF domain-containing protein [Chloroflexi bacterium]|nr:GGDEF domain-containing protein [Chloroflexota bacterium]